MSDEVVDSSSVEYEKLAQEIYQTIHDAEGFNTIDVQHNVKVRGRSGCNHQIDVYWEFKMAGETHRVAIECKDYTSCISVGRVRDFFGVLHDIGNIKGIFVTKVGYQSGAKKFATYYGISTKELRVPTPADWEGRIKDIKCTAHFLLSNTTKRAFDFDVDWIEHNTQLKAGDPINVRCANNQIHFTDKEGNVIHTMWGLENELPREPENTQNLKHTIRFEEDTFVCLPDYPPLKVFAVHFVYDTYTEEITSISEGESIAKAILKDVTTGDIKFFTQDGDVRDVEKLPKTPE